MVWAKLCRVGRKKVQGCRIVQSQANDKSYFYGPITAVACHVLTKRKAGKGLWRGKSEAGHRRRFEERSDTSDQPSLLHGKGGTALDATEVVRRTPDETEVSRSTPEIFDRVAVASVLSRRTRARNKQKEATVVPRYMLHLAKVSPPSHECFGRYE